MLHIRTKAIPVEAAHSTSFVKKYHVAVRRAFHIIKKESPIMDDDDELQMAVKSINDSTGPDGLLPTLLVFWAITRLGLPNDPQKPSTFN